MAHLFRLIAALIVLAAVLAPRAAVANAGCTAAGSNWTCNTQAIAESAAIASCVPSSNHEFDSLNLSNPLLYFGTAPNRVIGYYSPRQRDINNGAISNCPTADNRPNFYWLETYTDPCEPFGAGEYLEVTFSGAWPPSGIGCRDAGGNSCDVIIDATSAPQAAPGGGYTFFSRVTYTGQSCSDNDQDTDPLDTEDAGDGWECNPDTGLCIDPNGDGKLCTFNPDGSRSACVDYIPGDDTSPEPTPPPENEDGDNDPRNDNRTASGGSECNAPPQCSGDQIECSQLWQLWAVRCKERNALASVGGAGCTNGVATSLNCTNMNAAECFSLQKQHEISCKVGVSGADEDYTGLDQSQGADVAGTTAWADNAGGTTGLPGTGIEDTGFLAGPGSCPTVPSVNVMGHVIDFDITKFCEFLAIGAKFVLIFAGLAAARIVGGAI